MAKYQDTVEILIQARDEARRELQGIRAEIGKTRDDISSDSGVVAGAAKLHHALQKVGAAADGVKSAMAATRGIMQGLDGDTEGMVESFKQLGFGIGEVVNQADLLFTMFGERFYGVTQDMIDAEQKQNAAHAKNVAQQNQRNAIAMKARRELEATISTLSRQIAIERGGNDERMKSIQILIEHEDQLKKLRRVYGQTTIDISAANRERGRQLSNQVEQMLMTVRVLKQQAISEENKTKEMEKQKKLQQEMADAQRTFIVKAMDNVRNLATNALKGRLKELRDEAASISGRSSTISLGSQSGRFVTGLRDQQARREDPIIRKQQELKESIERKADEIKQILDNLSESLQGNGTTLIPLNLNAGGGL